MINSTTKSQRLGDMLSNTTVVKIKPDKRIMLTNIESLKNRDTHVIRYKEVVHMNEKEMLVIKSCLDQAKQNPNDAHEEAVEMLVGVMQNRLKVKKQDLGNVEFLQMLINDYIVMTR